ncbi:S-layer homology domain-containing protein [Lysinibacillus capsici]|uniref:S-layer homology domain-containing protein n=1 Tax=Lysinibacillus capsici TaxID=2115968 RepID=UPI00325FA339
MRQRYKKIVSILLIFLLFFQWIPSAFADFTLATPPSVNYKAVAYGDGKYVVTDTTGKAYYSTNGSSWTQSTIITALQTINSVVYENNHFMAVDNSSNFYTSSDGQTWTTATSVDSSTPLHSVTYGYNKYVTVGNLGNMYVSSNGVTWQKKNPQTNHLYGVIYANNQFVAVGAGGTILTSPDGENWLLQTSNTKNILRSVIYANGQYVVVGQNGTILTSPDGVYWTIQYNLPVDAMSFLLTSVSYGNGHYVTVAASGKVYYSKNGINWYEQAVGLGKTILQGVTYGNGQFVVVGNSGTILYGNPDVPTQAPAVITLTPATNITSTGATVGGEVTFDGGAEITERGIVYSTSTEPTTENSEKVTAIGTTGAFSVDLSGLNPSSTYYYRAYAKNSVGTSYGENEMFETLTVLPELGGTVSITGEAKYDGVLTVDISGITYKPTTTADVPTYQWYRGNTVIPGATSSTYTLVEADIGEKLNVIVSADGTHATGSVTSGATATVEKANGPSAPSAPTEASKTPTSITLNGVAGQEYSRDNGTTWQDSPIFSGLTPDTEYMFITRVRETATHKASLVSAGAPIQTQPVAIPVIGGTVSIAGETKYGNVLTSDISGITYTPTTTADVPTYQWYRGNTVIPGATSSTYTLVEADIGEKLKVTVTADGTNATGSVTSGVTATVEKADGPSAPSAPTEASKTTTSITLHGVAGQEYSKDNGTTWQDSPIFSELTPNTGYMFITRVKETATHKASSVSIGTPLQTQPVAIPVIGGTVSIAGETKYGSMLTADISGITYTSTTIEDVTTYQWYRGNTAISGATSPTYTLVQADIGETIKVTVTADGTNATGSITSGETAFVEKADGPSAPPAPTEASKTSTSITLNGEVGQEYSKDNGATWQDSLIFNGLIPETEYTFITRVKETPTHKASLVSTGTSIQTQTQTVAVPEMGGTISITGETKYGSVLTADISGITYTPPTTADAPTYEWYRGNTAISGANSSTYMLVQADIGETIKVRASADGTNATGSVMSGETTIVEKVDGPSAPPAPTVASKTSTNITLNGVVGQEYSRDNGTTWQDSPIFSELTPDTEYTFITRVKETATHKASLVSAGTLENTSVISTFTITYNGNTNTGGTVPTDSETYEQGEIVIVLGNIGNLVKVGYTFEGWNTQADGRGIDYASASTVLMGSGNIILYAKWNPVTVTHTVSFNVAGGSAVSNQTVVHEGKANQPTKAPTKAGYTFGGWYTNNAYTTPYNFNTVITANTVIYAKWISNNTGGGNTEPSPNPDSGPSMPSPTIEEIVVDVESGDGDVVSKTTIKRTKNVNNTMNDDVTLTAVSATETIRKLKEQGNDKARIIIPDEKDQVNQVQVSIPKNVLSILQNGAVHLEIVTDNVRIEVPKTSLEIFNENLYFRLVPIKGQDKQLEIEEQAKRETVVQQLVEGGVAKLLGRPMTIETNMQSRPVKLTLPLPTDLTDRQLANLAIFIEHSDGSKEVVRGKIVEYQKGITGLQFEVNKFSTFSILYLPEKEEVKEPTTEGVTHLPYIQGYSDGTFRPNAPVTRAQMASMFARQLTGNAIPQAKATYTDTFQHDAKDAIEFATEKGLFKGVTATNFNPNGLITRAQMATVAARWIEQQCVERPDADFCPPTSQSPAFKDVSVHHWAVKAIDTVNAAEIMTGITADTFNPDGFLTRAQAVKVLNRLFERQVLIEDQTPLFKDVPKHHWAFYEIQEAAVKHIHEK